MFQGNGREFYVGIVRSSDRYVVSIKLPEYSKDELVLRSIRESCSELTESVLETYHSNDAQFASFKDLGRSPV